ncbi:MAG: ABC transporter substrate-binding protein [Chloroflexota bacterium]
MRNQRFFLLVVFSLLLVVPFSVMAQEQPIVIDFYYPTAVDAPITEIIQGYVDQFQEQNPGITINATYTGSYTQTTQTIQTELSGGGSGPDVAVMLSTDLLTFTEAGTIVPVQSYIDSMDDAQTFVDDFFPALLLNSKDEEGTIWSLPFQRSTPILFYNVEMLHEAGYDAPPENNAELLEMAEALTKDDGSQWGLLVPFAGGFPIWMFQSFAIGYGQNIGTDNPTEVFLDNPQVLEALDFSTKLGTDDQVGPLGGSVWGDTPTAFIGGQAAMIYHTTGSLTNILNNAPFEVGVSFLPSGPAGADGTGYGAPTGGGNLYLFDSPAQPHTPEELDAAWKWIEFLASPEIQSDWGAATGYIAARSSAWELDPLKSLADEHPQYYVARDQLQFADREFASYRSVDVTNIINQTLSGILSGSETDAAAALSSAQAQIDSLLAEYK